MLSDRAYLFSALCILVACQSKGSSSEHAVRVGLLPHISPASELRELEPFGKYLEDGLDARVDLVMAPSYDAAVDAVCTGKVDVQQLGGLTFLRAHTRCGAVPLVQRDRDQQFHSVFITAKDSPIHSLADLKNHSFAFGKVDSTSGYLMPLYFMREANVDADAIAKAIHTDSHEATARAVAGKTVDAGAMSESVFARMTAEHKLAADSVRVFYTTPAFVDDTWVAGRDAPPALTAAFANALLALDASNPQHKALLERFPAGKFVRSSDDLYAALRTVAEKEHLLQ